ncbi:hypothetical protein [Paeniglutamicibacter kerguelensis]
MGAIAAAVLAGCPGVPDLRPGHRGTASTRTTAYAADEFRDIYRMNAALEVNPARSLADLYERSELIVLGSVIDAEAGPSYPVRLDDGTTDANGTTILTVGVDEVLAGAAANQVKVWISSTSRSANDASAALMPADQLVWYLRPSEEPGIMYATARDGIIGSTAEGKLTTVLGGLGDELFPASITTVEELADSVAAFKKKSAG